MAEEAEASSAFNLRNNLSVCFADKAGQWHAVGVTERFNKER